jgi:hypothetical protein
VAILQTSSCFQTMKHILTLITSLLLAPLASLHAANEPNADPFMCRISHNL